MKPFDPRQLASYANVLRETIDGFPGFHGVSVRPDGPVIKDGREFIARYAIECYGWLDDPRDQPQSNSAQAFARQVYERYPAIGHDDHRMIVDIVHRLGYTIPDPHDWDHIGSALDMIQYMEQSR